MSATFWQRIHGGSTHFPIVLLLASVAFELVVWPAFIMSVMFVGWRLSRRGRIPQRGLAFYFAGMGLVSALLVGAGYSGGEMLLGSETGGEPAPSAPEVPALSGARPAEGGPPGLSASDQSAIIATGRQLFLKNCAHCHGADGHGNEGPDLHNLDSTDEQIAKRIRNGKKGQMTAFAGKLSSEDIRDVIIYLHTLKQ